MRSPGHVQASPDRAGRDNARRVPVRSDGGRSRHGGVDVSRRRSPRLCVANPGGLDRSGEDSAECSGGGSSSAYGLNIQQKACVAMSSGPTGKLNHVEVRISQNHIDVYASDAGKTGLTLITSIQRNLSFTRGLIWLVDVHYNAGKAAGGGIPNQQDHILTWDNVAFDGPVTYRDISVDVPDAQEPGPVGLINLGWHTTAAQPVALTTVPGVTRSISIWRCSEPRGAADVQFHAESERCGSHRFRTL